jgi:hypothetical protein
MTVDRQVIDDTLRVMPLAALLPPLGNVGLLSSIVPKLRARYEELTGPGDGGDDRDTDERKLETDMLLSILTRLHGLNDEVD